MMASAARTCDDGEAVRLRPRLLVELPGLGDCGLYYLCDGGRGNLVAGGEADLDGLPQDAQNLR